MFSENASPITPPLLVDKVALAKASPRVQSAARWFWWIAGLSLVNSAVVLSGGTFNFVLGLAVTQVADAIFQQLKIVALLFDALALAFFVGMGFFAQKGHLWAFVVGGIAYLCDGVVFAIFGDWLPVAFHAYALFWVFHGWNELRAALRKAREELNKAPEPAAVSVP